MKIKNRHPVPALLHLMRNGIVAPINTTPKAQSDNMVCVVIMKSTAYRVMSDTGEV
jgi:hypothetical protein